MEEIATPRLRLRGARLDDLDDLHAIFSHPTAMRYWSSPPHADINETRAWLASMIEASPRTSLDYVIERDGRVIGKAGCWRAPEVGYILHPDHWGQGIALEALEAAIPEIFAAFPIAAITADVDPRNTASLRLLGRLGFVETGRAERTFNIAGQWADSVYLSRAR